MIYVPAHDTFAKRALADVGINDIIDDQELLKSTEKVISVLSSNIKEDQEAVLNPKILKDTIDSVHQISDKIIVLISEMHQDLFELLSASDRKKIIVFTSGVVDYKFQSATNVVWPFWFLETLKIYQSTPNSIKLSYSPYKKKAKSFDCLLGMKKEHRSFIYNKIINEKLQERFELTYQKSQNILNDYILDSYIKFNKENVEHSMELVDLGNNIKAMLSSLVPFEIYDRTAYSIIAETNTYKEFSFFTEKTAKPILGKRLFVVFAGAGFLKNLRSLGFKTFEDVIDESYDNEIDDEKRYNMAFDQIKFLINQDQLEIYKKIIHITEHNFKLMIDNNWNRTLINCVQNV